MSQSDSPFLMILGFCDVLNIKYVSTGPPGDIPDAIN